MSEREAIRLVIASNQPIVRHGLGSILMAHDHLRLIGEAEDGTEAIQLCEMLRPALAIIGTQISDPDSIETTRTIRQRWPDIHVLVLAGPPDLQVAQETLEAGAAGVLSMQLSADELVDAITQAADGRLATASTAALTILRAEHLAAAFSPYSPGRHSAGSAARRLHTAVRPADSVRVLPVLSSTPGKLFFVSFVTFVASW